uniref:Putative conserved secreted protein n=1 Tax=Culex tarsalis TaxID=7177 RepID=A0A1Q3G596_CULTA
MARFAANHLSTKLAILTVALFCLTELHPVEAHVRDATVRRSSELQNGNHSRNHPFHINHPRSSRSSSSSNYSGAISRSSNDLVRINGAKPADHLRYGGLNKTQYMYEHVQTGSVTLPLGGRAFLEPDQNRTLGYTAKLDTAVYRQKPHNHHGRNRVQHRQRQKDWSSVAGNRRAFHEHGVKSTVVNGLCIKCPAEKTAIARKGLDGVLIEPPMLTTCRNQPISRDLYELETLFGNKFNFVLPHSAGGVPYSFLARVVNARSGKVVQTCDLRYKVIVKQCGRYHPKSKDLKVVCDLGQIWGSKCTFHCRNGGYLSAPGAFVECTEEQSWEGEEPYCSYNEVSDDYAYDSDTQLGSDCTYQIPPSNGRFACEIKPSAGNDLYVPAGTICRIKCHDHFEIPPHLRPQSVFECQEGRWNSTMRQFCHKVGSFNAGMQHPAKRRYG